MLHLEYLILIFLILFQSIFGIGLLIFGTPTFLILGYNFEETLSILLPISLSVSTFQFLFTKKNINPFIYDILKFSVIPLVFCLYFTIFFIDGNFLKLILSFLMISISLCKIFEYPNNYSKFILKKNSVILFIIGCIHGISNLGGGYLSLYTASLFKNNYLKARKAISFGYLVFATTQILTIIYFKTFVFYKEFFYLIFITPFIFFTSEFFLKNKFFNYEKIINYIVLSYGVILLVLTMFLY